MKLQENLKRTKLSYLCAFLALMLFSCDSQNDEVVPVEPDLEESCVNIPNTPLDFSGESIFSVYAIKGKFYVMEPGSFYTTAKLTHVKKHSYILHSEVYFPGAEEPFRKVDFETKILPGGTVIMSWPFEWWEFGATIEGSVVEQMMEHTGYVFRGLGIKKGTTVYIGKFDGNRMKVTSSLMAKQVKPGIYPMYEEIVEGPINMKTSFDLYVDQASLSNIN